MDFSELFPAEYRAFYHGALSLCVERFGGINSLSLLDIRECAGKLYPDRFPIPWLCRKKGATMNRPLYSPGIQFWHDDQLYVPRRAELRPAGFKSPDYSLIMGEKCVVLKFKIKTSEKFIMAISQLHMPEGKLPSLKNQLAIRASSIQWLPAELRGDDFNPQLPFVDDGMQFLRQAPQLRDNQLVWTADCRYADCSKKQYWRMAWGDSCGKLIQVPHGWQLEITPVNSTLEVVFSFGSSLAEAQNYGQTTFQKLWRDCDKLCRPAFKFQMPQLPGAEKFFEAYSGYQRHLCITETAREMMVRAAADKFGFFAMWDDIYPSRDFLLLGEAARTKKMLRYMFTYPWADSSPWVTIHLLVQLNEYLAYADDLEFLQEVFPQIKKFFEFNLKFVDKSTGLLASTLNTGVDCSAEVGLHGLFYAPCINGWWYGAVRVLENFALELHEVDLAAQCRTIAQKIEKSYIEVFFDPEVGYLRSGVNQDGSQPEIQIYQNTHTLGLDYVPGFYLFRHIAPALARYQAEKLQHPMGHTAVARDSEVSCEMWKAVHMNQHLGHECKLARFAGHSREAQRVMAGYLDYFTRYQCAIETFNYAGCDGDASQQANWQAFSATGAAQALISGVAGWLKHRGGWSWLPGDNAPSTITGLDGKNFAVRKSGGYALGLTIDGHLVPGTLQVPESYRNGENFTVLRTAQAPSHPVIYQAIDLPIDDVELSKSTLKFRVLKNRHSFLWIYAPKPPVVRRNGTEIAYEWNEKTQTLYIDAVFQTGDRLELEQWQN